MAQRERVLPELFDPDFMAQVHHLRLVARRVPRGGRFAEQRSADLGAGLEFRDYRAYTPGDELRAIDWNIYRRLGRVFVRLFEELEDLPAYLLVDTSRSMYFEEPPRMTAALHTAFALAAIALGQHDSVGLMPFSDDLRVAVRPTAGSGRLISFAERLAELAEPPADPKDTNLRTAIDRLEALGLRRGLAVVISDFFDPRGLEAMTTALGRTRHQLLLVQLVRRSDRSPTGTGDVRLRDCETGRRVDVSITPAVRRRYEAAYDAYTSGLHAFARRRRAGLIAIDVAKPVVPQLAAVFEGGRYEA